MNKKHYQQLNKKDQQPIKYQCVQPEIRQYIKSLDIPSEIKHHIDQLYDLIFYQMQVISKQEAEMISIKHKNAWTHYDKSLDQYDKSQRRFLTPEE
jgi:hypothetical protein